MAVEGGFHDDVEVQEIIEEAIDLDDVGMVDEHLDFDLSYNLIHHVALHNLPL